MSYLQLIKQHAGLLLLGFLALFSGNLGQTFFIGLFQAPFAEHYQLTSGQFGIWYSVVTLAAGFLIYFAGPALDWVAPRFFGALVVAGMSLGIVLMTLSPWAALGIIGLGLVRLCGQGLFTHLGATVTGKAFTHARGKALGLVTLGIPVGEAILPSAAAALLVIVTWRELWWGLLAGLLMLWLPLLLRSPAWPAADRTARDSKKNAEGPSPLRELRFWQLSLLMLSISIINTGVFVYQAQMTSEFGASTATYALGLIGAAASRFPGALLGGRWVDRFGAGVMGRLYLLPLGLGLILAVWWQGNAGIVAYMVCSGLVVGMQEPVNTSLLVRLWGAEHLARVRSTLVAAMVFASGIAPALFGALIALQIPFFAIMLMMVGLVALAWGLALAPLREVRRLETAQKSS